MKSSLCDRLHPVSSLLPVAISIPGSQPHLLPWAKSTLSLPSRPLVQPPERPAHCLPFLLPGAQDWPLDPWHLNQEQHQSRDWPAPTPSARQARHWDLSGACQISACRQHVLSGQSAFGLAHNDRPITQPHSSAHHLRTALLLSLLLG